MCESMEQATCRSVAEIVAVFLGCRIEDAPQSLSLELQELWELLSTELSDIHMIGEPGFSGPEVEVAKVAADSSDSSSDSESSDSSSSSAGETFVKIAEKNGDAVDSGNV